MKDCLEEHREDPGFSAECKEEFEIMMEARAADFRCALLRRHSVLFSVQLCCLSHTLSTGAPPSSSATDAVV